MRYTVVIDGRFATLNEYIDNNRISNAGTVGKGRYKKQTYWNKGQQQKKADQNIVMLYIQHSLIGITIKTPIRLHYTYYERDRRRDKDNVAGYFHKVFQDALVTSGAIADDGWNYIEGFSDTFYVDKDKPRIEVTIEEVES